MFTPRPRPASGPDIVESIPKLLFYTWFSLFTALALMAGYLSWFGGSNTLLARSAKPTVAAGLKSAASVYDYIKIRPHQRRAKPKKPFFSFTTVAAKPCGQEAPLP